MLIQRKTIKFNNSTYYVGVSTYPNKRVCLTIENKKEKHYITINFDELYVNKNHVLLDPIITRNGLLRILKKKRIIKSIYGATNYGHVPIPIAEINLGILKRYDYLGVMEYLDNGGINE